MKKGSLIDGVGDEVEESTGNGGGTDVVEAVVIDTRSIGGRRDGWRWKNRCYRCNRGCMAETAVEDVDDGEVVATVGRMNVEDVEETGNGNAESRSWFRRGYAVGKEEDVITKNKIND